LVIAEGEKTLVRQRLIETKVSITHQGEPKRILMC